MQIQGAGYVSSASSVYSAAAAQPGSTVAGTGPAAQDSASISAFSGDGGSGTAQDLNSLYEQKAQAEGELGDLKGQAADAQAQINARRGEINKEQQGSQASSEAQDEYDKAQAEYEEAGAAKSEAQQRLNQISQESSSNAQAINANAQQKQQVSSEIASVQGQLASLNPPAAPSGDDAAANADYQSRLSAYNEQKNALQSRLAALQQQLQQLEAQAQQLQAAKAQLDAERSQVQAEIAQQDAAMQSAQAAMNQAQQALNEDNPELQQAVDEDAELQSLQEELDGIQQEQAAKEAELKELEGQISAAEAKDEGLQAARADEADREFQDAAAEIGCDAAGSQAGVQENIAQDKYGKSFEELSNDEKLAVAAEAGGEVTLEIMDRARQLLAEDPANEAAEEVLAKARQSLEAKEDYAKARLGSCIDKLPADVREGAAAFLSEAYAQAQAEGADADAAVMDAFAQFAAAHADSAEFSSEEKAALQNAVGAAADYFSVRLQGEQAGGIAAAAGAENAAEGEDASVMGREAASCGEVTELDDMKKRIADKFSDVKSKDDVKVISGTKKGDEINVTTNDEGKIVISVNGKEQVYTADEAKRLVIDGGDGDDVITVDESVTIGLNIMGGKGDDSIRGGAGNDYIVDDYGHNVIRGGAGDDVIRAAGKGGRSFGEGFVDLFTGEWNITNDIYGGEGSDIIYAGDADDYISGGDGDDLIYGGGGDDYVSGGYGKDVLYGGYGKDEIRGGGDDDILYGGDGKDEIYGGGGDDILYGNKGKDTMDGGAGSDTYASLAGENAGKDSSELKDSDQNFVTNPDVQKLRETMPDVSEEKIKLALGTDGDDEINIRSGGSDGSLIVSINGKEKTYTAEEAKYLIIDGGDGSDKITVADDVVYQKDKYGNEYGLHITGGYGDDRIIGGSGKDVIYDNYGGNNIDGGAGDDVLMAHGLDKDGVTVHRNTLVGGEGNDYLEGGDGNDYLSGGNGYDVIYGLSGDDTIFGGGDNDYIDGGLGNDKLYGGGGDDNIIGGKGDDRLYGGEGADLLIGASGTDKVDGQGGADKVIADTKDDVDSDEDDEDIEKRETMEVPENFSAEGDRFEIERIESDFEFLASVANGQMMFEEIAKTGHDVTVSATNGGSVNYSSKGSTERGVGCDTRIEYNLTKISLGGTAKWKDRAPVISMFHEMCHSYNAAIGNMNKNYYDQTTGEKVKDGASGSAKGVEWQAVGLANDDVEANPELLTENSLRALLGFERRERY